MHVPAMILRAALAAAPPTPIDHVTVEQSSAAAQVIGFDATGEPAIELVVWMADGEPRLTATLPNGESYVTVVIRDGEAIIDSQDLAGVEAQLAALNLALAEPASWLECAVETGSAIGGCIAASPWLCVGGAVFAACECLPLMIDEFEGMHCPLLD